VGVLCHSGTAQAGHYYSFIRDRLEDTWYEFNDSTVTPWDDKKQMTAECFGGEVMTTSYTGYQYKTETTRNAYILVYQRKGADVLAPATAVAAALRGAGREKMDALLSHWDDNAGAETDASAGADAGADADAEESGGTGSVARPPGVVNFGRYLRSLLEENLSSWELAERLVPPALYREVFEDNVSFVRDARLFTTEFYGFAKDFMEQCVKVLGSSGEASKEEGQVSLQGKGEAAPTVYALREALSVVGGHLMLEVLARSSSRPYFKETSAAFATLLGSDEAAARHFLRGFVTNPPKIGDFVVRCPDENVRTGVVNCILAALKCIRPAEVGKYSATLPLTETASAFLAARDALLAAQRGEKCPQYVGMMMARPGPRGDDIDTVPASTTADVLDAWLTQVPYTMKNWTSMRQYWRFFQELAAFGEEERQLLHSRSVAACLVDAYLGNASPMMPVDSVKRPEPGNSALSAKWDTLLASVLALLPGTAVPGVQLDKAGDVRVLPEAEANLIASGAFLKLLVTTRGVDSSLDILRGFRGTMRNSPSVQWVWSLTHWMGRGRKH
jgi:hypothetical protein